MSVRGLQFSSLTNNNESQVKSENKFLLLIFAIVFGVEIGKTKFVKELFIKYAITALAFRIIHLLCQSLTI